MGWREDVTEGFQRVPTEELPEAIAECERQKVLLWQRLNAPPSPARGTDGKRAYNRTVQDVMQRFSVKRSWVYAHKLQLGGKKLDGALRFCEADLERYESTRRY